MKIIRLKPLSPFSTNCYLVVSEKGNAVLVDAPSDSDYIIETANNNNCTIKKMLLTHGHCDHIGAMADIVKKTGCEVYIHKNDEAKLSSPWENLTAYFGLEYIETVREVKTLEDGDIIALDELQFEVIHTPGHTGGSVCYVIGDVMFSGDTLFNLSIGRTDMPDGDYRTLFQSLHKLFELPKDYTVYPGHMDKTTLSFEKSNNPYI